MPMFRYFNKDFFRVWSKEMAYVLGYTFADGAVYTNSRGSCYLEFTSTDRELIYKVRKLLASEHKISLRKRSIDNPNWKNSYRIQIGGKELLSNLRKFGIIQNKRLVVKFPIVPKEHRGDFVRGYFDGDGGVNFGKYKKSDRRRLGWSLGTHFTSGSKDFLIGLKSLLKENLSGGCLYRKSDGSYSLTFSRHDSVALFKLMYHNTSSEMFLERKYHVFLKAFQKLKHEVAGVA